MRELSPAILALGLSALGALLVFGVIRRFRDLSKDGPLDGCLAKQQKKR